MRHVMAQKSDEVRKKMEQWLRARLNNNHLKLLMD